MIVALFVKWLVQVMHVADAWAIDWLMLISSVSIFPVMPRRTAKIIQ